jgi:uncharacterized protein (DUF2236 family)
MPSPNRTSPVTRPHGPSSVIWQIDRERIVLLAGPAAAVLQVAHPVVARGVAAHSRFREDSSGRLARTLEAVYTVTFGTPDEVEQVRRGVARAHAAVRGEGYSAFDPEAQLWVLATLIMGSIKMFERFVAPLEPSQRETFLQENAFFGQVFGVEPGQLPATWTDFENYWQEMMNGPILGSLPLCGEVARAVIRPDAPATMRWLSPVFRAMTLELLPAPLSERLGLGSSRLQRPLWKTLDALVPRLLPILPARLRFAPHYLRAMQLAAS